MSKNVKGIILAAGEGARLKKYTENLPKGMLRFAGKTLIGRQIDLFHKVGIEEIVIIKGFAQGKIDFPNIVYYANDRFDTTNMLVSLFCAEERLQGNVVVSYADILFEVDLLKRLMLSEHDIVVPVDTNWQEYWNMRYGSIDYDTESLQIDDHGWIISLGKEGAPIGEIDARYIGLLKFSAAGVKQLKKIWIKNKDEFWEKPWQVSGKPLSNAYITDMLQALIDEGNKVYALKTKNGWIEFDTNEDYENALKWYQDGTIRSIIKVD